MKPTIVSIESRKKYQRSQDILAQCKEMIIPKIEEAQGITIHRLLAEPCRLLKFRGVPRNADGALIHSHGFHGLLVRSTPQKLSEHTLFCDWQQGMHALGNAAAATDVGARLQETLSDGNDKKLAELQQGFALLKQWHERHEHMDLWNGCDKLRTYADQAWKIPDPDTRHAVYRTFVLGQHYIPQDARTEVDWNTGEMEALLIRSGAAHMRSLLGVDPDGSLQEMEAALESRDDLTARGLQYVALREDELAVSDR